MKKIVFATVIAALSTTAFAQYYVKGDIGYSKLEAKFEGVKIKDNATSYGVAVGKDLGNIRYQADYTNFGKLEERGEDEGGLTVVGNDAWESTVKTQSLGVSAIYDFQAVSGFVPYVGARIGVNQLEYDEKTSSSTILNGSYTVISDNYSAKETKVGVGVLVGAQYTINPQLAVDVAAEYNHLGKVEDIKFNQYGVKVGLRYNF